MQISALREIEHTFFLV